MQLNYRVEIVGTTEAEVREAARAEWAKFIGDPDAALPQAAVLNVEADTVVRAAGEVRPTILTYRGELNVTRMS